MPAVRALASLLDVLFPPRCAACDELLPAREVPSGALDLCDVCEPTLEPILASCASCGLPSESFEDTAACEHCLSFPPVFDGACAAFLYGAAIAQVLHRYKYEDRPHLAGPLSARLAALSLPAADVVVPIPLHAKRRRSRTYDQALYLAQGLARRLALPCDHVRLVRTRSTAQQVGQSRDARASNVAGAFDVRGDFTGLRVLLVDDVVTTGATASECTRALREAGATAVHVVSVARAA